MAGASGFATLGSGGLHFICPKWQHVALSLRRIPPERQPHSKT